MKRITLFLLLLYFLSRFTHLTSLPIFNDEAIYIDWAIHAREDASARFISLGDGKQPLFIWLTMLVVPYFQDPLLAGRTVSIFAGFFTCVGLFLLSLELFRRKLIAYCSALFYILSPFALLLDTMALYDSLTATLSIWSIYLAVLLAKYVRLDITLLLALSLGAGILTKTSGFLNIYLLPLTLLVFSFPKKNKIKKLFTWAFLAIIASILALGYYGILLLSPDFRMINEKNAVFVYHLSELIPSRAFWAWPGNILKMLEWIMLLLPFPFFLFAIISFFTSRTFFKEKIMLLLWFAIPFIGLGLFGRLLYPRYFFFMCLPLFILAAFSTLQILSKIRQKSIARVFFLFLISFSLVTNYYIFFDFANAPLPKTILDEYINNWPAGGGLKEVVSYLSKVSQTKKIFVVTEGIYGSLPTTVAQIYLGKNANIERKAIDITETFPFSLVKKACQKPTYIVTNQRQALLKKWPVRLILSYQKGIGDSYIRVYKLDQKLCELQKPSL